MIRLNKFLAQLGIGSRRQCDRLIEKGKIKINGEVVTELGVSINEETAFVEYEGKVLSAGDREHHVYVLLNKPLEVISTANDEFDRPTVVDLISTPQRIYPVGRLDYETSGVLLLTNDGELTNRLIHPRYKVRKEYKVLIDRKIRQVDLHKLRNGIELDGQKTLPCKVEEMRIIDNRSYLKMELREGRNRQIRRMFEALDYEVEELERVSFAGLTCQGLRPGEWRYLHEQEVEALKNMVMDPSDG